MSQDAWVCANCRSVNPPRSDRCYRCHVPEERARLDAEAAAGPPAPIEAPSIDTITSTAALSFIVRIAIVVAVVIHAAAFVLDVSLITTIVSGTEVGEAAGTGIGLLRYVELAAAGVALVFWAIWLSRVVGNIPALTGEWPRFTPRMAFIEHFLPGPNLFRVPSIVRDVLQRLPGPTGPDTGTLTAWWIALAASLLLPRPVTYIVASFYDNVDDLLRLVTVMGVLSTIGLAAAGILTIDLVGRIEDRQSERAAARRAEAHVRPVAAAPAVALVAALEADEPAAAVAAAPALSAAPALPAAPAVAAPEPAEMPADEAPAPVVQAPTPPPPAEPAFEPLSGAAAVLKHAGGKRPVFPPRPAEPAPEDDPS